MIRNLLYSFILLFAGNLAIAQISLDPQVIEFVGEGQDGITKYIHIINNTDGELNLYWIYEPAEGYPEDWSTQICDINLCYAPNKFQSSSVMPNVLPEGADVQFSFKVWNNSGPVEGTSYGILKLYDDSNFSNLVAMTSAPAVAVSDLEVENLVIYPNPTTEFFQLKNDASIASISIYNIVGRVVKTLNHTSGMLHDVTSLRTGMYLVRLENEDGDVVKSMRLSKK